MSWVRLDDGFADHPKVSELDDRAFRIHIWALWYSARHLTDGFIAHEALAGCPLVSRRYTLDRAQASLIGARLWKRRKRGIQIRDFLEFNPSRAQVLDKRQQNADRQARYRERHKQPRNASRNASRAEGVTHTPTPPQKAGNGTAPLGSVPLPLDDCMACGELRPLRLTHEDRLVCEECQ
jgi:hypothetical protein